MSTRLSSFALVVSLLAACGDGSSGTGASGGTGGTGGDGGTGGTGGTGGAGGGGSGGGAAQVYGSIVILGDSISDGGGEAPFFYDLLVQNDDAAYPSFAGKDLLSLNPDIQVVHEAVGGAQSSGLASQINKLPATLPGPVLVTITIGGNDMQANALKIIQGTDGVARMTFGDNVSAALDDLLAPDRFGPGVEVTVLEANIYDPTSGTGDFGVCGAPLNLLPVTPSDGFFGNWNMEVTDAVTAHGQTVVDAHTAFFPYPVDAADTWYNTPDCIHPNAVGHDGMRAIFWSAIESKLGL